LIGQVETKRIRRQRRKCDSFDREDSMRSISIVALLLGISLSGAAQAQVFRGPCKVDSLCPGVERGGGKILNCLRTHKSELSEACFTAIGHFTINRSPNAKKGSGAPASEDEGAGGAASPGDAGAAAPAK
jgi:hypothetical protein